MIKRESPVPLYVQIREYLRSSIVSGTFPEYSRIPSERQLAEQFDVNRLTVSKALADLVQDGLIQTHVGKGTFVSPAKIDQELHSLTSFTEDMTRRGQQTSSRVLIARVELPDQDAVRALRITPRTPVIVLQRVRLADEQAISLETSTVLESLCPGILEHHNFARESLYAVLRSIYGVVLTHAEQTIESRQPAAHEVDALEVEPDCPILSISRVTFSDHNQPVEFVRSAYRGDRYKFRAMLRALS